MFALFVFSFSMVSLNYFFPVHGFAASTGGIQQVSYSAKLQCYGEQLTASWTSLQGGLQTDTAMCEFPALIQRYSVNYNYTVRHNDANDWTRYPLVIEFNETITRFSSEKPLKYVESGDGIVRSQRLNGYHAKQLIKNLNDYEPNEREVDYGLEPPAIPTVCDANGGYRQVTVASMYLVVYPQSLSEQSVNHIHTNLTYDNNVESIAMKDANTFFQTTLNSTGMICSGQSYVLFTTTYSN